MLLLLLLAALPAYAADALVDAFADPGLALVGFWTAAALIPSGGAVAVAYAAVHAADDPLQALLEGLAAGAGGTALGPPVATGVLFVLLRAEPVPEDVMAAVDGALPLLLVSGALAGTAAAWAGAGFPGPDAFAGERT